MGIKKNKEEKKNYTIKGKPMPKGEFVQVINDSEDSGTIDLDKGIELVEERLSEYRKVKKK
jgi:hypothetical protein